MKLYDWQTKALDSFEKNHGRGIVVAVTGVGKTYFALNAFKKLKVSTLIVVPTIALLEQWKAELIEIGVKKEDIGLYYGLKKDMNTVTVAVINSVADLQNLDIDFKFLIMDEIHRYGSESWSNLLLNNNFKYRLGLTATLERTDGNHDVLTQRVGKVIYQYSTLDAVDDELLNEFSIVNVGLALPPNERAYLVKLDRDIADIMKKFDNDFSKVTYAVKKGNREAGKVLALVGRRKKFYNNSLPKICKAVKLIMDNLDKKIIVFGEFMESVDILYNMLKKEGVQPYVYYSGSKSSKFNLNAKDKQEVLDTFGKRKSGVLLTVRALDEGLNSPDLSVAVWLGGSSVSRQAIQRMGRILRKKEGKKPVFYFLYYRDTKDFYNAKNFSENFREAGNVVWK